jgi:uncharacterized membrane protein
VSRRDPDVGEAHALAHMRTNPELGKERIAALTDGIAAFAMTLLVLGIGVPTPDAVAPSELPAHVASLAPEVGIFVLSFATTGLFWIGSHQFLHLIGRSNRVFLWLNLLFLLTVVLLPFTTGTVGHYPGERVAVVLYGANLVAGGLSLQLLWTYAGRARLYRHDLEPDLLHGMRRRSALGPAANAAGAVVGWFAPWVGLAIFAAVAVFYVLPSRLDRHLGHRRGQHD